MPDKHMIWAELFVSFETDPAIVLHPELDADNAYGGRIDAWIAVPSRGSCQSVLP